MYGKATLDIPAVGNIGRSRTDGLSDELALILGRTAAWTLSEQDGYVTVTLESGLRRIIGPHESGLLCVLSDQQKI